VQANPEDNGEQLPENGTVKKAFKNFEENKQKQQQLEEDVEQFMEDNKDDAEAAYEVLHERMTDKTPGHKDSYTSLMSDLQLLKVLKGTGVPFDAAAVEKALKREKGALYKQELMALVHLAGDDKANKQVQKELYLAIKAKKRDTALDVPPGKEHSMAVRKVMDMLPSRSGRGAGMSAMLLGIGKKKDKAETPEPATEAETKPKKGNPFLEAIQNRAKKRSAGENVPVARRLAKERTNKLEKELTMQAPDRANIEH
jgi:hypothetical protein